MLPAMLSQPGALPAPNTAPQKCNGSPWAHRLAMAMHHEKSPARKVLELPNKFYPLDVVAACAVRAGWIVDACGVAWLAPDNLEKRLADSQQLNQYLVKELAAASSCCAAAGHGAVIMRQ